MSPWRGANQLERVLDINGLNTITVEIVGTAREVLVIGGA